MSALLQPSSPIVRPYTWIIKGFYLWGCVVTSPCCISEQYILTVESLLPADGEQKNSSSRSYTCHTRTFFIWILLRISDMTCFCLCGCLWQTETERSGEGDVLIYRSLHCSSIFYVHVYPLKVLITNVRWLHTNKSNKRSLGTAVAGLAVCHLLHHHLLHWLIKHVMWTWCDTFCRNVNMALSQWHIQMKNASLVDRNVKCQHFILATRLNITTRIRTHDKCVLPL